MLYQECFRFSTPLSLYNIVQPLLGFIKVHDFLLIKSDPLVLNDTTKLLKQLLLVSKFSKFAVHVVGIASSVGIPSWEGTP